VARKWRAIWWGEGVDEAIGKRVGVAWRRTAGEDEGGRSGVRATAAAACLLLPSFANFLFDDRSLERSIWSAPSARAKRRVNFLSRRPRMLSILSPVLINFFVVT
jgi:hypothetical protein